MFLGPLWWKTSQFPLKKWQSMGSWGISEPWYSHYGAKRTVTAEANKQALAHSPLGQSSWRSDGNLKRGLETVLPGPPASLLALSVRSIHIMQLAQQHYRGQNYSSCFLLKVEAAQCYPKKWDRPLWTFVNVLTLGPKISSWIYCPGPGQPHFSPFLLDTPAMSHEGYTHPSRYTCHISWIISFHEIRNHKREQ